MKLRKKIDNLDSLEKWGKLEKIITDKYRNKNVKKFHFFHPVSGLNNTICVSSIIQIKKKVNERPNNLFKFKKPKDVQSPLLIKNKNSINPLTFCHKLNLPINIIDNKVKHENIKNHLLFDVKIKRKTKQEIVNRGKKDKDISSERYCNHKEEIETKNLKKSTINNNYLDNQKIHSNDHGLNYFKTHKMRNEEHHYCYSLFNISHRNSKYLIYNERNDINNSHKNPNIIIFTNKGLFSPNTINSLFKCINRRSKNEGCKKREIINQFNLNRFKRFSHTSLSLNNDEYEKMNLKEADDPQRRFHETSKLSSFFIILKKKESRNNSIWKSDIDETSKIADKRNNNQLKLNQKLSRIIDYKMPISRTIYMHKGSDSS